MPDAVRRIDPKTFRQVSYVTGDVTADGASILLRVGTERDGHVDLALPTVDLQHLVTLLLISQHPHADCPSSAELGRDPG
jgi:hypothetical protein